MTEMQRDSAARCIASVLFIRMVLPCSPFLRCGRLFLTDDEVGEVAPCQLKRSSYERDDSENDVKHIGTMFTVIRPSTGENQCLQAGWPLRRSPSPDW